MHLQILLPSQILIDQEVIKVVAEAENGAFCLLPRHRDFVTALVPSILAFTTPDSAEQFLAVDEGILIKSAAKVHVSTRQAVMGTDLDSLRQTVQEQFERLDERERLARAAVARLEADFMRRFLQLGEHHRG